MQILPAIDIYNGQCVRLHQGRYDKVTTYANVLQQAQTFVAQGASTLHVIDLTAAKDINQNSHDLLRDIIHSTSLPIQFGGGIRSLAQIKNLFEIGVTRVIIGSLAISDPALTKKIINIFGKQIILAFDFRLDEHHQPMIATNGWQCQHNKSIWDMLELYNNCNLQTILCTDISRDGTLLGPNIDFYRECQKRSPDIEIQAAGGIGQLHDLTLLKSIPVSAAVVGKALYENCVSLRDAIEEAANGG